jgi:hypothetical protein
MVAKGVFTTANLTSYCSVGDVLALLEGYDLSDWGDEEVLVTRASELLSPTKAAIDSAAGRDFMLHPDETVLMDGTGDRVLLLAPLGLVPVAGVSSVKIGGVELPADDWLVYAEEAAIVLATSSRLVSKFPAGRQNIEVNLDWGHENTPADIVMAQAKLVAAELLAVASGESGTVEAVSLGDYSVRYADTGRFAYSVQRLVHEATEAVARHRRLDFCSV